MVEDHRLCWQTLATEIKNMIVVGLFGAIVDEIILLWTGIENKTKFLFNPDAFRSLSSLVN